MGLFGEQRERELERKPSGKQTVTIHQGKIGPWAGTFDGSANYVNAGSKIVSSLVNAFTIVAWINPVSLCNTRAFCAIVGDSYSAFGGGPYGGFNLGLR